MTLQAILSFTQNAASPGPGVSMVGVAAQPVTLTSEVVAGAVKHTFEMLDVPLNSGVPTGIIYTGPNPTCQFTPDAPPGCYRVRLIVSGPSGTSVFQVRNFAVATAVGGLILPSFKATADELNFPGNTEGWEQILNEWLLYLLAASGGGSGHTIVVNGTYMPQRANLYFKGPGGEDEPIDDSTILIFPRSVTTAERATISAFDGLTVFDTDLNRLMRYNTNAWETA